MSSNNHLDIYEICKILSKIKPPSIQDIEHLQKLFLNWNDKQKVTDKDINWVKKILNIPQYCKCRPGPFINHMSISLPQSKLEIFLNYSMDNPRRAFIPRGLILKCF